MNRKTLRDVLACVAVGMALGSVPHLAYLAWPSVGSVAQSSKLSALSSIVFSGAIEPRGFDVTEPTSTRLLFVGDIMLDRNVKARSEAAHDLSYPFQKLPTGWFDTFDYAVANLEGPVTAEKRPPEKTIDFQFDPAVLPILRAQGIDALSQANNHSLDQGRVGSDDSRSRLQVSGFTVFGDQVQDGDVALATTTVNGLRLALLGFNTTDNPLDREAAAAVLEKAKAEADRVIVCMHWGTEYKDHPDEAVVELAHWLIDHGADAVIGGHPHWVQGFSSYKGRPIAWSLGNFVFDQDFSVETRQGLAVAVTLAAGKITFTPIPLEIDQSQPRVVEGEERARRLGVLADISDPALQDAVRSGTMTFELEP